MLAGGYGPVPVRLLDAARVDGWLLALRRAGYSPAVVREARETLAKALWWAKRRGLVRENVAAPST